MRKSEKKKRNYSRLTIEITRMGKLKEKGGTEHFTIIRDFHAESRLMICLHFSQ